MSPIASNILEILKYILPSIVVLIAAYLIIDKFLTKEIERKRLAIFGENTKTTIPMRLQAYERLTLFLERMNVQELLTKFYAGDAPARDLQLAVLQNIRAEFEYNLSQQIYVSKEVWQAVVTAKEQEVAMLNAIAAQLPQDATAKQLITRVNDVQLNQDSETPRQIALGFVNNEAKHVLLAS
jgi:hypothetical protein